AGDKLEVPNVPKYDSDGEEEFWFFSDGDDDEDVNEESDAHDDSDENKSDDEGDDFFHPNLSTYTPDDQDDEENIEDEEKAEDDKDMSDQRRVTILESELSMLKQSNPFAEAISSIHGIVDKYLATKMIEEVDVAVQLKSDKLREEA
ncbi:hypothetical protein Tco_1324062, partial [Tanacetum coccineum]